MGALPRPDLPAARIAAHFRNAGLSILHLAAATGWTIPDILNACIATPDVLAEGYREALEQAMTRVTLRGGGSGDG